MMSQISLAVPIRGTPPRGRVDWATVQPLVITLLTTQGKGPRRLSHNEEQIKRYQAKIQISRRHSSQSSTRDLFLSSDLDEGASVT